MPMPGPRPAPGRPLSAHTVPVCPYDWPCVRGTRPKTQPWFQNTTSSAHVSSRRNTAWGGCTARGAQGAPPAVPTHALAYFRGRAASPPRGPANKEKHRQQNSTGREGAKRALDKARMPVSRKDNLLPNVTSRLGVPPVRPRARGRTAGCPWEASCGSRQGPEDMHGKHGQNRLGLTDQVGPGLA